MAINTTTLPVGSTFGNYRVEATVGAGGMGEVYQATHLALETKVALKVIRRDVAADEQSIWRFLQERKLAAKLHHPNVVRTLDGGEQGGVVFMVMDFIDGIDLGTLIEARGAIEPPIAARIFSQVADALDEAHKHGLIHRDVKPANILLEQRDDGPWAFLADFGLARLVAASFTMTKGPLGTPFYMAPELWGPPNAVDKRADIWALGVVLFQMLTASLPFYGESFMELVRAILDAPTPSLRERAPHLPQSLDAIIQRATAKDKELRFESAGELAAAVRAALRSWTPVQPAPSAVTEDVNQQQSAATDTERELAGMAAAALGLGAAGDDRAVSPADQPVTPGAAPPAAMPSLPAATPAPPTATPAPPTAGPAPPTAVRARPLPAERGAPSPGAAAPAAPAMPPGAGFGGRDPSDTAEATPAPPRAMSSVEMAAAFGAGAAQVQPDLVDCTVFAPEHERPDAWVLVQVYLHKPEQVAEAAALAAEFDTGTSRRGFRGLEVPLPERTLVDVELDMPECRVEHPVQRLIWRGRAEAVQFDVQLPAEGAQRVARGTALVRRDGIPIGRVGFRIGIEQGAEAGPPGPQSEEPVRFNLAFISYASADRVEVLRAVQGVKAAGLRIFQDLLTLEAGERYEQEIYRQIDECDLFLLFWSKAAKDSLWVRREVARALERSRAAGTRLPEVRPVLVGAPPAELPWPELEDLHFNDLIPYVIGVEKGRGTGAAAGGLTENGHSMESSVVTCSLRAENAGSCVLHDITAHAPDGRPLSTPLTLAPGESGLAAWVLPPDLSPEALVTTTATDPLGATLTARTSADSQVQVPDLATTVDSQAGPDGPVCWLTIHNRGSCQLAQVTVTGADPSAWTPLEPFALPEGAYRTTGGPEFDLGRLGRTVKVSAIAPDGTHIQTEVSLDQSVGTAALQTAITRHEGIPRELLETTWRFGQTNTTVHFLHYEQAIFDYGDDRPSITARWELTGTQLLLDVSGITLFELTVEGSHMTGTWRRVSGSDMGLVAPSEMDEVTGG